MRWSVGLCALLILPAPSAGAVDCTPNDITLLSQAEVDAFQANHGPGCDRVVGTLIVSGADVANLDGLAELTSVWWLQISDNPVLTDTTGLSSVTDTPGVLEIRNNAMLTSLSGLSGVTDLVGGALILQDNASLTDLSGLSGLSHIGASLVIRNNDALVDVNGLSGVTAVASNINIANNDALQNVSALAGITGFTAALDLRSNPQLTNLPSFSGLNQLSGLILRDNDSLTNVDELAGLSFVGNQYSDLWIRDNASLTNLDGLADLVGVDAGLEITGNSSLDSCSALSTLLDDVDDDAPGPGPGVAGIPDVDGDVIVGSNLPGCNAIEEIVVEPPPADETQAHYGGLDIDSQQLLFKGRSVVLNCFDDVIPVPSEDAVLSVELLHACSQTAFEPGDTLAYDVSERRCRTFTEFAAFTRLDIHAVYLDNVQPGDSLIEAVDSVLDGDVRALLRFDPLSGDLESQGMMRCPETGIEVIFADGFE